MREDNEVSRPSTILCSTRRVAQLRPVRLDPSAYPSRPDATETQSRAQSSMISGSAQTAVADTNGTAGKHSATADVSRFTRAATLLRELNQTYWKEVELTKLYEQSGTAAGPKAMGAKTRRDKATKIIEGFSVYDEKYVQLWPLRSKCRPIRSGADIYCSSNINEGRDEYSRAQAKQDWNTAAERFLNALK
jgi:hypothetical protein